ncbi:sensor histidine kinase [Mucilaginibacter conchicola]|uniref:sensor histidine kinase n=1 Tax=Mucilaginibacter conchicola TaxID=2303333 RepID=UPI00131424A8|nr:sensor histidine kinase [Mucilaginibacter conchicola]
MDKPGDEKSDMDSTSYYADRALELSRELNLSRYYYECILTKACLSATLHEYVKAETLFKSAAKYHEKTGDKKKAALTWLMFGDFIMYNDIPNAAIRKRAYVNSYTLFRATGLKQESADLLGKVADADMVLGNLNDAERELLSVIKEYKVLKYRKIYLAYYLLAEVLYRKNEIKEGLLARIETANLFEQDPHGNDNDGAMYYFCLAGAYYNDLQEQKALEAYLKCMKFSEKVNMKDHYYLCVRGAALCYSKLKKYREGLEFIKKYESKFPDRTVYHNMLLLSATMQLYTLSGDLQRAGRLIGEFRKASKEVYDELPQKKEFYRIDNYIAISDPLLRFYMKQQQWDEFAAAFKQLDAMPKKGRSVLIKRRMLHYAYTIDSVNGDFFSALKNYRSITRLNDSINNSKATEQIHDLEAKYRSLAKDKTIQELHSETAIQKATLERRNAQFYGVLAGSFLILILACLTWYAYRHKIRINLDMSAKQLQINEQNRRLSTLLDEKEKLITEKDDLLLQKEWLLKEVHHRVKNNLQIVMSLLYGQSSHLESNEAVRAIRKIQNQIQSIAIIHQKLYTRSGLSTIRLADYVHDLIGYLSGVYTPELRKIKITQHIDTIVLDPAQAVPVGLIMNEAVTNAIKYAFDGSGGEIKITASASGKKSVRLIIADNGKGFESIEYVAPNLGMEMMAALSKQINGTFERKNDNGAMIIISFEIIDRAAVQPAHSDLPSAFI